MPRDRVHRDADALAGGRCCTFPDEWRTCRTTRVPVTPPSRCSRAVSTSLPRVETPSIARMASPPAMPFCGGRRALERLDHAQADVRVAHEAEPHADLRHRDAIEERAVLRGLQVDGVAVVEMREHRRDRRLVERRGVERAHVVLGELLAHERDVHGLLGAAGARVSSELLSATTTAPRQKTTAPPIARASLSTTTRSILPHMGAKALPQQSRYARFIPGDTGAT